MADLQVPTPGPGRARAIWLAAAVSAISLGVAWSLLLCRPVHARLSLAAAGFAGLFAAGAWALNLRPETGRLARFGKNRVMVRSLNEWTLDQFNCGFDQASQEQQSAAAMDHYRVGVRLISRAATGSAG